MIYAGCDNRSVVHENLQDTLVEESMHPQRFFDLLASFVYKGEESVWRSLVPVVYFRILDRRSVDGECLAAWVPCERGPVIEVCCKSVNFHEPIQRFSVAYPRCVRFQCLLVHTIDSQRTQLVAPSGLCPRKGMVW